MKEYADRKCPKCGAMVLGQEKYCPNCHTRVGRVSKNPQAPGSYKDWIKV